MQVQNSAISLTSAREYKHTLQHSRYLNTWSNSPVQSSVDKTEPSLELAKNNTEISTDSPSLDPKFQTLKLILEALTGKKIHVTNASEFKAEYDQMPQNTANTENSTAPEMPGWGVDYQENITMNEADKNHVTASGIVNTKDGKNISFSIDLSMERTFQTSTNFSFKAGDALIDPLVINLDSNAADLTDAKFKFDINSDGTDENLSWLNESSGFLVFDKNGDGIVNNGRELFGPETSDGFNELAELDYDNNGFIDENDPDFKTLMLWTGRTNEESELNDLGYHGIGAIGLINVESEFSVKDDLNNTRGEIRKTGIYLKENGLAGTIQQLDLSV
jgi:hypothetical protein